MGLRYDANLNQHMARRILHRKFSEDGIWSYMVKHSYLICPSLILTY